MCILHIHAAMSRSFYVYLCIVAFWAWDVSGGIYMRAVPSLRLISPVNKLYSQEQSGKGEQRGYFEGSGGRGYWCEPGAWQGDSAGGGAGRGQGRGQLLAE